MGSRTTNARTWAWVLTANFGEGLPYAIVNTLMVAMLADMGMSAGGVTMATSLLALPWALKALWSPVVDVVGTKRGWMLWMQALMSVVLAATAVALGGEWWRVGVLTLAGVLAVASATYDVACDGYYMVALPSREQSFFVGIRSMAYRLGMLLATGGLVALAGRVSGSGWQVAGRGTTPSSWMLTLAASAGIMAALAVGHGWLLPRAEGRGAAGSTWWPTDGGAPSAERREPTGFWRAMVEAVSSLVHKGDLLFMLLFLFTYRLGEAFLSKVTILFLKADVTAGGLGLDNGEYGLLYGTLGVLALTAGGIVGGMAVSRWSLGRCIVPMALALNVPDLLYVWLASVAPQSLWTIGTCVAIEQLGYGFGFTAYTVYLLECARGEHQTAHYAILTALMAIGMTVPSVLSGFCAERMGYVSFFWMACLLTLPGIAMSVWYWQRTRQAAR